MCENYKINPRELTKKDEDEEAEEEEEREE